MKHIETKVKLHKDFILKMFDPNFEKVDEEIPDITGFKMLLRMLAQMQTTKSPMLHFNSKYECLNQLGYTSHKNAYDTLKKTLRTSTSFIKFSRCEHDVWIQFNPDFCNTCNGASLTFDQGFMDISVDKKHIRNVDINKIDQIDSPLTLKIYLLFIKRLGHKNSYKRLCQYELVEFLAMLGFVTKEYTKTELRQLKFRIKKALTQIADVDSDYRFTLDEELFASRKKLRFNEVI